MDHELSAANPNENKNGAMVFIPSGAFLMGGNNGEIDGTPVHEVSVSSFFMSRTEITQEEYRRVTGKNSRSFKGTHLPAPDVS